MKALGYWLALALPTFAHAAGPPPGATDNRTLDFAVEFANSKSVFHYKDGTSADTTLRSLGVTWYERMSPRVELGLYGGHAFLAQTGNVTTAGIEPDGYYAGIGVRAVLAQTRPLQLFFHATYSYQRVSKNDSLQSVTLSWDQPQAQLGVAFAPVGPLRAYGGISWGRIDGQERATGTTTRTINFETRRHSGGFAGLDFAVEQDGYVGMEAHAGLDRGAEIYFKKRF